MDLTRISNLKLIYLIVPFQRETKSRKNKLSQNNIVYYFETMKIENLNEINIQSYIDDHRNIRTKEKINTVKYLLPMNSSLR